MMTPYLPALGRRRLQRRRPDQAKADVSIDADRPSASVCRRICEQQFRQKEKSPSASSRPVQVGLPQSSLESAAASRARESSEKG
jgi:hypothetical protein